MRRATPPRRRHATSCAHKVGGCRSGRTPPQPSGEWGSFRISNPIRCRSGRTPPQPSGEWGSSAYRTPFGAGADEPHNSHPAPSYSLSCCVEMHHPVAGLRPYRLGLTPPAVPRDRAPLLGPGEDAGSGTSSHRPNKGPPRHKSPGGSSVRHHLLRHGVAPAPASPLLLEALLLVHSVPRPAR
jgi:hypothetical protein